jgi:hypothetical protein
MSETAFILHNCTKAMFGSSEAIHLVEQKSRLEQAVLSNDPSLTLDTSKSLLESIFKTILSDRIAAPDLGQDFKPLYKNVRDVLVLNQDVEANEILKKLTNAIVHNIAELRNKYGSASHGDDGCYENPIQMPEAEMVAHIVDGMGGFLLKKNKDLNDPEFAQRIYYNDYAEFNDWLDSQNESIKIPVDQASPILFSVFLFTHDVSVYRAMLLQYIQTEKEDADVSEDTSLVEIVSKPSPVLVTGREQHGEPSEVPSMGNIYIADDKDTPVIATLLEIGVEQEVEPARIQLIAEKLSKELNALKTVDWQVRENIQSQMRTTMRITLRKLGYPIGHRDDAIAAIMEYLLTEDAREND